MKETGSILEKGKHAGHKYVRTCAGSAGESCNGAVAKTFRSKACCCIIRWKCEDSQVRIRVLYL